MFNREHPGLDELINLAGKTAIVTGGGRGIGYAICKRMAEAGAVVVIADIDETASQASVEEINDCGYSAIFYPCDVTREQQIAEMSKTVADIYDGIDILVNNAGVYPRKPFLDTTGDDFRRVLDINLTGAFLCSRYVAQQMVANKICGSIVNIASIEATHPSATGMVAYGASKAGLVMLARGMARELGLYGIRVNTVAPGGILTQEMTLRINETGEQEQKKQLKEFFKRMALGRMGEADDVARVVLFLASDLAAYITGDTITVDGGYLVS